MRQEKSTLADLKGPVFELTFVSIGLYVRERRGSDRTQFEANLTKLGFKLKAGNAWL